VLSAFHQPLIAVDEISRKKAWLLGWALIQWLARGHPVLGDIEVLSHLISHVVLCGMSIAK
jgi:hypothetical protein